MEWFCTFDQKTTKYYECSVDETKANLPLTLRRCNHWKNLATLPLQELPFLLLDAEVHIVYCTRWARLAWLNLRVWFRTLKLQRKVDSAFTTLFVELSHQAVCELAKQSSGKRSMAMRHSIPEI